MYKLLRSYLTQRKFQVHHQEEYTQLYPIHAGVPQGSILGPIFYTIFTADLPVTEQTTTATYADDTAILASHEDPIIATTELQTHLHRLEQWPHQWQMCANESKSRRLSPGLPKRTTYSPTEHSQISWSTSGSPTHMENAHSRQKETTRSFVQTNVLDHWKKIRVIA